MVADGRYTRCTVAQLRRQLMKLKGNDILYVNELRNLKIIRKGDYAGYIELGNVEFSGTKAKLYLNAE
jgi:hypothetical protein